MADNDNLALVKRYIAKILGGDLEGALRMCRDDTAFQGPDGSITGKDGVRAIFAQIGPLMVNPMEYQILGTTCEGNRVAVEATGRTQLANGNVYANIYHFLFEIDGGQIVASREYCDTSRVTAFA